MLNGHPQQREFDTLIICGVILCSESLSKKILIDKINVADEVFKQHKHEENFLDKMHHQIYKNTDQPGEILLSEHNGLSNLSELYSKKHKGFQDALRHTDITNKNLKASWNQVRLWGRTIVPIPFVKIVVTEEIEDRPVTHIFRNFDDFKAFIDNGCRPSTERKESGSGIEVVQVRKPGFGCAVS